MKKPGIRLSRKALKELSQIVREEIDREILGKIYKMERSLPKNERDSYCDTKRARETLGIHVSPLGTRKLSKGGDL